MRERQGKCRPVVVRHIVDENGGGLSTELAASNNHDSLVCTCSGNVAAAACRHGGNVLPLVECDGVLLTASQGFSIAQSPEDVDAVR